MGTRWQLRRGGTLCSLARLDVLFFLCCMQCLARLLKPAMLGSSCLAGRWYINLNVARQRPADFFTLAIKIIVFSKEILHFKRILHFKVVVPTRTWATEFRLALLNWYNYCTSSFSVIRKSKDLHVLSISQINI